MTLCFPAINYGLSHYKLTEWSWVDRYIEQMGTEDFFLYLNNVYKSIEALFPMQHYNILKSVPAEKQDLFVKCGCLYIQEHGGIDKSGVKFSIDYTELHRFKIYHE